MKRLRFFTSSADEKLILLGIAELVAALMDIKSSAVIAVVLGVLFIGLGVKTLLDIDKKK